ncbi:hypothetical protein AGDE_13121 [Angomonas deanei]|uniref:Uncharacterized protein n=1 Tax=Angomonas deanei TaxID=59799 RepID=A0A7G2CK72_9TRYP|nr:hypothetical protein AGDE_13121 [Angomonas deanei]CAD2218612.1 hypothetical protein, conserved [Angomonas deanei]|eukprot:EPY22783.1 hypothetical protein AGDE_13121 [Angomonas deanei]
MPVDLLVKMEREEDVVELVRVVTALQRRAVTEPLQVVNRALDTSTKVHLVLEKDGSRVDPTPLPFTTKTDYEKQTPVTGMIVAADSSEGVDSAGLLEEAPPPFTFQFSKPLTAYAEEEAKFLPRPKEIERTLQSTTAESVTALLADTASSHNPLSMETGVLSNEPRRSPASLASSRHSPFGVPAQEAELPARPPRILPALDTARDLDCVVSVPSDRPGKLTFAPAKRSKAQQQEKSA